MRRRSLSWLLLTSIGSAPACANRPGAGPAAVPHTVPAGFSSAERARIAPVQPHVETAARTHRLDPALLNGLIWVESRFQPDARSPAGARGLMQLMPATAKGLAQRLGERPRPSDPGFNVRAGSLYLAQMLRRYDGDVRLALAAYNAGPGNVDRWHARGGLPEVSVAYVDRVLAARARFAADGRAMAPPPAPTPAPRPSAGPAPRTAARRAMPDPGPVTVQLAAPVAEDLEAEAEAEAAFAARTWGLEPEAPESDADQAPTAADPPDTTTDAPPPEIPITPPDPDALPGLDDVEPAPAEAPSRGLPTVLE